MGYDFEKALKDAAVVAAKLAAPAVLSALL